MLRLLTWASASTHANAERATVGATGHGLTRWQLLDVLSGAGATVPAAARELRQSRQATQRLVDALERSGLVERVANPAHRTSPIFRAAPTVREMLATLEASVSNWVEFVSERLANEDVQALSRLLIRVREIADEYSRD